MHYTKLAAREKAFKETGIANSRKFDLAKFTLPVTGEDLKLEGYTVRPSDGYQGYFYSQKFDKKRVVLHFTVGHMQGDINDLSDPNRGHVSTSFVVGRDGTVYQLFSSYYWSYHLGRGAIGGNGANSKTSVGIEISSYGPLVKKGDNLETIYSKRPGHDVYCSINDKDQYIELDEPYRGYKYYSTFTDEQYESIIVLLRYLTARYEIPRAFVDKDKRFEATAEGANFSGIITHVNSRADKVDIGPAFDWDRVTNGVAAAQYPISESAGRVAEIESEIEELKKKLKKLETELLLARQDAEDAAGQGSRDANQKKERVEIPRGSVVYFTETAYEKDNPVPVSRSISDAGDDGYESEEEDKSDYYMEE